MSRRGIPKPRRVRSEPAARVGSGLPTATVLTICVLATIWIGVLPTVVIDFAHNATLII